MAKLTLLQMVQSIMSDMDSDEVTSISDTVESAQVASTVQDVYFQLITDQTIPEFLELKQLGTVNLTTYPGSTNYLQIPDTVSEVRWLQYNVMLLGDTADRYSGIPYKDPGAFIDMVSQTTSDAANAVQVTDPSAGITYHIYNDKAPEYWTTFDDKFIAFNSIDSAIDTVQIVGTKSRSQVSRIPTWTVADNFVPDVDDNIFPLLLAEAKSTCFFNLKQTQNNKIEGQSRGQRLRLQNHKFRTSGAQKDSTGSTGPNYGRRQGRTYSGLKAPNF